MIKYISKRILYTLPTLWLVSFVAFMLSRSMPGDPIDQILANQGFAVDQVADVASYETAYAELSASLHYDLPIFYGSIDIQYLDSRKVFPYPRLQWHGLNNQYHKWCKAMFTSEAILSNKDQKPVAPKIKSALGWSLFLSLTVTILVSLLSIPLGIYTASRSGQVVNYCLFGIYSIPVFWLATLCLIFLTTAEYGSWIHLFPAPGIWQEGTSWYQGLWAAGERLILPIILLVIHSMAYMTKLVNDSMQAEFEKPYTITARSKGLSELQVTQDHMLRNAFIPIATSIIDALPRTLAGSLIIEIIFNIPGMGRLLYESIRIHDWNILLMIILIIAIATMVIYIIGDVLYAMIQPKVTLHEQ